MKAGELEANNGIVLPPPPTRPSGARFLLSRSDAGTLIVTLPSPGVHAALSDNVFLCDDAVLNFLFAGSMFVLAMSLVAMLYESLGDAAGVPVVGVVVFCANWLAARAFTSATLSVGAFEWEYKETVAGVITMCYRQGPVEELDIYHESHWSRGDTLELITGCKKVRIGGHSQF